MFRDLSIKKKLTTILMIAGTTAVLLACIVFSVMIMDQFRKIYEHDLSGLAQIVGQNCEAALAFKIPEEAERVLASLEARPSVSYAVILDSVGNKFASFGSDPGRFSGYGRGHGDFIPTPGYTRISREIIKEGAVIGYLILFDDMREIRNARVVAFSMMAVAVMISTGVVFLMVSFMQRLISKPMLSLSSAAERISKERDYSLRAEKYGNERTRSPVSFSL